MFLLEADQVSLLPFFVSGIGDPRLHLAQSLSKLSTTYPGVLSSLLINPVLTEKDRAHLKTYLDKASVQIS